MKKLLLLICLVGAVQTASAESMLPKLDLDKVIESQKKSDKWVTVDDLGKYGLELKQDMKGYYLYNSKTKMKHSLEGLTPDFQGEDTFNCIGVKRDFLDLCFNLEDLKICELVKVAK